jgi:hypothetical protein
MRLRRKKKKKKSNVWTQKEYLKHSKKMRKGGKYARKWVERHGEG